MFERIEISEYIYEGVVEPYYKKPTGEDSNCDYYSRKIRREAASPTTYSSMSERSGKNRKRYVYHSKDISKPTCLIHGPGH